MKSRFRSAISPVGRHGPAVLVLLALVGLAYTGHRSGWKVSKFSEVWGHSAAPEPEDWCEAHNVPQSRCIACNPELVGADPADWCKEHGMPESKDPLCHPEILTQGQAADWCGEHGVPESQCTLCHPEIAVRGEVQGAGAAPTVSQHPGFLNSGEKPASDPTTCQTHVIRVQFASAEAVRKAGLGLEAVQERPMAAYVTANGELDYDQARLARLSTRAAGTVWRVEKEVGQAVAQGEVLAFVDAAEVGRAKAELLQSLALVDVRTHTLARVETSATEGFRTRAELAEAQAALRESRIRLFNAQQALNNLGLPISLEGLSELSEEKLVERVCLLGLSEPIKATLDPGMTTANLIPVTASFDGVVIAREVVAGEVVDTSKTMFVVADLRRMWVMLDLRLEDAASLALGQTVRFRPDGVLDDAAVGTVAWISTAVDEKTRTVRVRAEVENPDGRLRAHTFGTAHVTVREAPQAVAVPKEAVQWEGCCHVVFVRLTDEIFQTRKVRLGTRSGGYTEVLVGVLPGEVVATTGSHVLKAEILKSKLGAGCVDE